ncbi:unnamed protein product, partial [Penicillium nalgiovense]
FPSEDSRLSFPSTSLSPQPPTKFHTIANQHNKFNMDELRNNLGTYPDWGFVIYRTTYSAESDTLFPDAIRFIEGCIKQEFFQETNEYPTNEPNEI